MTARITISLSRIIGIAIVLMLMSGSRSFAQVTTFTGANFNGAGLNDGSSFIPPDTMGAVGINHYVETLNGSVRMFTKNGALVVNTSQDNFFSTRAGVATSSSFDPRVQFDRNTARWFVTANDNAHNANSSTLLAVSTGSDPTAGFSGFRFDMDAANTRWADYNTLGVSRDWITIQNNMFANVDGALPTQISLLTIPKASLLAGNTTGSQYLNNLDPNKYGFTAHAATDLGFGGQSATAYTLSAYNSGSLQLSKVSGLVNSPTYTDYAALLNVAAYHSPVDVPQAGTSILIDSGDSRIGSSPVLVNGVLWAVHNVSIGSTNLSQIRLYRIDPATNAVLSQVTVPTAAGLFTLYPSIAVNPDGDIVVGFSGSNSSQFVGAYTMTGRFDGTNFNWGTEQLNAAGVSTYNVTFGSGRNRWGDYSATTLDPTDPGIFWSSQEYVSATNIWRVRNTELIPTRAGQVRWQTAANGSFTDSAAWINGSGPSASDHAIFSRWGQTDYTVSLPSSSVTLDRLSVRQTGFTAAGSANTVKAIFDIAAGGSLNLTNASEATPSLAIAEFAGQAAATFTGAGTLNTQSTIVAGGVGSIGNLTVNTTWNNTGNVFVGGNSTSAGGVGTLNVDNGSNSTINGTLRFYNAATGSPSNRLNIGATSAANLTVGGLTNNGAGTVAPIVNLATSGSLLHVNGTSNSTYGGTIIGTGSLSKSGAGTFTLSGTNTYTGTTVVNAGTLSINGNQSSATGSVTVNGGKLSGVGTIGGAIAVSSGGTLEAGNSIGTLTVANNVTVNSGGKLQVEIGAGSVDLLNMSGGAFSLDLKNGSLLSLVSAGFINDANASSSVVLVDLNGTTDSLMKVNGVNLTANTDITSFLSTGGNAGTTNFVTGNVNVDLTGFNLSSGQGITLRRDSLGDLVLVFTPVPEPAFVLAVATLSALGWNAYRRFHKPRAAEMNSI